MVSLRALTLRTLTPADAARLVEHLNDEAVYRYLSSRIPQPYTLDDANWWIETGSKDKAIVRAIEYRGDFCGVIGATLQAFEHAHSAEVGYWLARPAWGNGIATAALRQFSEHLFAKTEIRRLFAGVFDGNLASARVLEKAGYEFEGIRQKAVFKNGQYLNEHLYARLAPSLQ